MSQYSILKNEWLKWIDGPSVELGRYTHIDKDGNIYACGYSTSASVSINNSSGTLITYAGSNVSLSNGDFLIKFDKDGVVLWFKWINGTADDFCSRTITTDTDGYVYYSGYTTSASITIANTQGTLNTFSGGSGSSNQDIFIMKLSSDGNTVSWVKWLTGSGTDFGHFLKIDNGEPSNYLCLCGMTTSSSIVFNSTTYSGGTISATNNGFILKIDLTGTIIWFKWIIGATGNTNANINIYALDIDSSDNIIIGLWGVSQNLTIGGSIQTSFGPLTTAGRGETTFIVKFNSSGVVQWIKSVDGNLVDNIQTLVVMADDNICISGYTTSTSLLINGTNYSARPTTTGMSMYICILNNTTGAPTAFKWLDGTSTSTTDEQSFSIKRDLRNNLYLVGSTPSTSITIDGTIYTRGATGIDGFILKLNGNLVSTWFKWITGTGIEIINGIALNSSTIDNVDSPDIYIIGNSATGNLTFQGTVYTRTTTTQSAFLLKLAQFEPIVLQYSNIALNDVIMLPIKTITGTIQVNWGDGSAISNITSITGNNPTHTYTAARVGTNSTTIQIYSTDPTVTNKFAQFGTDIATPITNIAKLTNVIQFGSFPLTSLKGAFLNATSLAINTTYISTPSTVTDMSYMFYGATYFNQDLTFLTTTNVTNMSYMFYKAESFDQSLAGIDTSNVTNMSNMFNQAYAFNSPLFINTSKVTNMSYMFYADTIFDQDLSVWNTSLVTNMSYMFWGAETFNTYPISSWITSSVINMSFMFYDAMIFNQSLNSWIVSAVTNMSSMFNGAISFNQDLNSWTVTSVTNMGNMFKGTSSFNGNIIAWNTLNVTDMNNMFYNAILFNKNISGWNTVKVTKMNAMFKGATIFNQPINTSGNNWNTSVVTTTYNMFSGAVAFNQDLNSWDVSSVITMSNMFYNCPLFNGNITSWNPLNVADMSYMFHRAFAFNQPLNSWNVGAVTNMSNMFYDTTVFNQPLNSWNVSSVTDMSNLFFTAPKFNQPLNNWNVSSVSNMNSLFFGNTKFNQNLSSWNVSNVTNMTNIFNSSGLSNVNYTYTLMGWSALPSLQSSVPLGAIDKQYYTDAASAHSYLTTTKSWTITDGGVFESSINPRYGSPFRYYKWLITKTRSLTTGVQASEFVFYDYYKVPILLTTFTITNPSGTNPAGNEPSKLIDNNFFTMWVDSNGVSSTLLLDLGVNYITVQKPYSYSWITGDDNIARDPSSWKLYGSNNSTIWFLLNDQTDYVATTTRNTEATLSIDGENYFPISYPTTSPLQLKYSVSSINGLTITLPLSGTVNVAVNWDSTDLDVGDPKYNAYTTSGEKTHTYSSGGTYTVEIDGTLTQFGIGSSTYPSVSLLTDVVSFGEIGLTSLSGAFYGATNLLSIPTSLPIKSSITDLSYTFKGAINFGGSTGNDNITKWNVASVSNMAYLFSGCLAFNKDVSKWFLYKVTNMSHLFSGCSTFNKNISNWNVSSATDMSYILADCSSFNQDLSNWNISSATNMDHFFHQTSISRTNYDNMLIAWSNSNPQNTVSTFYADSTKYSYGNPSLARYKLTVSPYQWSITDAGIETTTLSTPMSLEYHTATGNLTITLPLYGIVDVLINWGDTSTLYPYTTTGDKTHTYSSVGTFTVSIYNRLTQFGNGSSSYANADRLYKVNSFGDISLTSLSGAFYGATNLTQVPTSLPTSSTITDLSYTFKNATSFNQDISNWTISSITTMENMFYGITLSTANYDLLLNAWALVNLKHNVLFNAGSSKYSYGLTTISKNKITDINNYNWTILDGGQDATTIPPSSTMVLVYTVSSSKTITLPLNTLNNTPINVSVDWGDSTTNTYTTIGNKTHTYSTAGDYLVKITGSLIQFGNGATGYTNPEKLVRVLSFGNLGITSLSGAFYGCSNLIEIPSSIPSSITTLDYTFYNCTTLNDINITYWNMTNVINIDYMLYNTQSFDQNIFGWTVPNLTHFQFLLYQSKAFKQPITGWLLTYLNLFPLTP